MVEAPAPEYPGADPEEEAPVKLTPEILLKFLSGRRRKLGETLVDQQLITDEELNTALIYQQAQPGKLLGTVLRELGLVSDLDLMEALSGKLQVVKAYSER